MTDQISPGVRIGMPPAPSEVTSPHRRILPLWATLFLTILFWFLTIVFIVFVFHVPKFQSATDAALALGIVGAWMLCMYVILLYVYVRPARALLSWLQKSRSSDFEHVVPVNVSSLNEVGQLVQEVGATIALILQLREREQELLKHKSDTITLIEHQLRTVLTSLQWSLAEIEVPSQVREAVVRMNNTVQEIINAARIGEGTFGYVFGDVDIVPLLENLISRFKSRAVTRGVTLAFDHAENLPHIKADMDRLNIAISNVLSNAIEYTPLGGAVSIVATKVDDHVDVSVKDTGIGMSQEDLANLFTKMYRGKSATKMRPDGSGLGLYVARNILNEHGAEVLVRSEEGHGTQFSFRMKLESKRS